MDVIFNSNARSRRSSIVVRFLFVLFFEIRAGVDYAMSRRVYRYSYANKLKRSAEGKGGGIRMKPMPDGDFRLNEMITEDMVADEYDRKTSCQLRFQQTSVEVRPICRVLYAIIHIVHTCIIYRAFNEYMVTHQYEPVEIFETNIV